MKTGSFLDADMATIGRWLGQGLTWWQAELAGLVPVRWSSGGRRGRPAIAFDGLDFVAADGAVGMPPELARKGVKRLEVRLVPSLCLSRTIALPAMSDGDMRRMLALDGDRLMPLPGGAMLVAGAIRDRAAAGTMAVAIAGLPRVRAEALASAMAEAGVVPQAVTIVGNDGATIDFLPTLREAGVLRSGGRSASSWWAVVAFLFLLNIGLLVVRDITRTDELANLVEAQRPAVGAARRIMARTARDDRIVRRTANRRERRDALAMLGAVSAAMPDGAWAQTYAWDGATLRIAGYSRGGGDVIAALRAVPGLSDVRSATSEGMAEIPAGKPFDVSARIGGR